MKIEKQKSHKSRQEAIEDQISFYKRHHKKVPVLLDDNLCFKPKRNCVYLPADYVFWRGLKLPRWMQKIDFCLEVLGARTVNEEIYKVCRPGNLHKMIGDKKLSKKYKRILEGMTRAAADKTGFDYSVQSG